MNKGQQTREAILNGAAKLASRVGLEALSIGALANNLGMSKSGLFAHFGSKEELQLATLHTARQRYEDTVFLPAMNAPRGLPRLRSFFDNWLTWLQDSGLPGGCVLLGAVAEYDDRPGPLKDMLAASFKELRGAVVKAVRIAMDEGHLRDDTDPWQFSFELFGIVLAASHDWRLHKDTRSIQFARNAFEQLIVRQLAPPLDPATVSLRPVGPQDLEREKRFVAGLSTETLYRRRMGAGSHQLSQERLEQLTNPVAGREYALAATVPEPDGEQFIGVARYALSAPGEAEFAIVIADTWQRLGVGKRLLLELIAHARSGGVKLLRSELLATNQASQALLRSAGFAIHPFPSLGTQLVASMTLETTESPHS